MQSITIVFILIGLLLLIGFLRQFGLITWRGFLAALFALFSLLGLTVFYSTRRKRMLRELKRKEQELRELEKQLNELCKRYDLRKEEIRRAEAALNRERAEYARKILQLEAEKEREKEAAKRRIAAMTVDELLDAYQKLTTENP